MRRHPCGVITAFPHGVLAGDAEHRLRTATRGDVQRTHYRHDAMGDAPAQGHRRCPHAEGAHRARSLRAASGSVVEDVDILRFFAGADRFATVEVQTVEGGEPASSAPRLR